MSQMPERAPLDVYALTHAQLWGLTTAMVPDLPGLPPYVKRINMIHHGSAATLYADIEWTDQAKDVRVEAPIFYSKDRGTIEEEYEETLKAMRKPAKTVGPYLYEFAEQQPPTSDTPELREPLYGFMQHAEKLAVLLGGVRTPGVRETLRGSIRTDAMYTIALELADIALMFARYTGGDEKFFMDAKQFYSKPAKDRRRILYESGELPTWLTGAWSERTDR